jgi:hypothetical protein
MINPIFTELYKALLQAQSEMPSFEKVAVNPFHKNKYATLQEILTKALPVLRKHGLLLTNITQDNVINITIIHVETAQSISTAIPLIGASDMQKMGSAITYAERYGLLSLLGLAPDMDDDGNSTMGTKDVVPVPTISNTNDDVTEEYITDGQRRTLADISHNKSLTQTHKDMLKTAYEDDNTTCIKAQHIIDNLNKFVNSKAS